MTTEVNQLENLFRAKKGIKFSVREEIDYYRMEAIYTLDVHGLKFKDEQRHLSFIFNIKTGDYLYHKVIGINGNSNRNNYRIDDDNFEDLIKYFSRWPENSKNYYLKIKNKI